MMFASQITPRSVGGVTLAQSAALVPPLIVVALAEPDRYAILLAVTLGAALIWEAIFAVLRRQGHGIHGVTTALIVTVLVPPDIAVWQLAFVVSLGVVLGELVFGGRGFGFVHPATVAVALLMVSFPQIQLPASTQALAVATLPGALLLLALGLISWRIIVATAVMTVLALFVKDSGVDLTALSIALVFGLIFLICDPLSATATNPGRLAYGALAGVFIVVFSSGGPPTAEAIVLAALMASVFAPLIDHLVTLAHARRREKRHA